MGDNCSIEEQTDGEEPVLISLVYIEESREAAGMKEYKGSVKFVRVDMEKSSGIAERYHIIAVPTILLFQNSQPVKRLLGFQERSSLKALLNSATAENETTEAPIPEGNRILH